MIKIAGCAHSARFGARGFVFAVVAMILVAVPARAGDRGVQFTPDGKRVLANKDVGTERWAIALNADGTVTGNVFRTDGGMPAFIACDPLAGDNAFACFGADPCSDDGGVARGIQRTPDGERVLVSKDVGPDRWAITLNGDGTVTGNVFRGGGGAPAFLACDPLEAANSFACFGADACNSAPCDGLFSFIDDVTLPAEFFEVPASCGAPFGFLANVTLPDGFFALQVAEDVVSSIATGDGVIAVLRIGAAPIPGLGAPNPIAGVLGNTNVSPGGTNELDIFFSGFAGASASTAQRDSQSTGAALVVAIGDEACAPTDLVSDWFEVPLDTASGQLDLSVSFSEALEDGDFVICITTIEDGVIGEYFVVQQTAGESPTTPGVDESCFDVIVDIAASDDILAAAFFLEYPPDALSMPGSQFSGDLVPETAERATFLMPFTEATPLADFDLLGGPEGGQDGLDETLFFAVTADESFPPGDVARISFDCVAGVPPPPVNEFICTVTAVGSGGANSNATCGVRAAP